MSKEDRLIAQRDAQRIVREPEIAAAFERIKAGYQRAWANTKPDESAKRETAYMCFKAISDMWADLTMQANSAHVRDLTDKPNG